jgi:hypothetical protein
MKNLKIFCLLALAWLVVGSSGCKRNNPEPQEKCYKGVIIGNIRSWGGGVAISMESNELSNHQWRGYNNVVEALNISAPVNSTVYFTARLATESEKNYPVSADGDESAKPIIMVTNFSTISCSALNSNNSK